MKKIIFSFLLICPCLAVFAQIPSIGIKGGINLASLQNSGTPLNIVSGSDIYAKSGMVTSFNFGVFADVKIHRFSIQPAVNFSGKGGTFKGVTGTLPNGSVSQVNSKFNIYYLEVPVNIIYHIPFLAGELYLGAGPYVAMGIYARRRQSADNNNNGVHTYFANSNKITFGNEQGDIKSNDVGAQGIAGIKLKGGLLLNFNYDLGLANILPDASGNKFKNRVFGASVGYVF